MRKEIFRLREMLEKANIPFEFRVHKYGFQIGYPVLPPNKRCDFSIIEREKNKLEINDETKYVTAEDAFVRIAEDYGRKVCEHLKKLNELLKNIEKTDPEIKI